jgi:hypothetical protein
MTAHSTAQGIASLGRYGDDLIVHMNQEEVQGLQALAKKHGTSLTINPDTGMPEAFKLGKVFKAVLPIAAGFALGPGGFASGMFEAGSFMGSALGTGLLVGGATAALTGNLGQGLMAGLGAYGGFGLSDVYSKMGAVGSAAAPSASTNMGILSKQTGAPLVGAPNNFTALGAGNTGALSGVPLDPVASFAKPMAFDAAYGASTIAPSGSAAGSSFIKEGVNLGNTANAGLTASPPKTGITGLYDRFTDAGGKASQLYMPAAGAALAGVEPSDFYEDTITPQEKQSYEQTGVDSMGRPTYGYTKASAFNPYRSLNLSGPSPLNLGVPTKSYATGGTIQSGGIRDIYGTPDNQPTISPGLSGFGLGRLNNLAGEQALDKAKTLGYAEGGETSLNVDKLPTLNVRDQPSLNVETGRQNYTTPESFMRDFYTGNMPFDLAGPPGQLYSYVMKGKLNDGSTIGQNLYDQMMKSRTRQMAKGGYLDGAGDGMSDSIPATIEGKQPARLADGEFVIPADVVSHLGNGSSKAGSKRLYAMMQKVRKARTGNPKQGKQINPNKYLMA